MGKVARPQADQTESSEHEFHGEDEHGFSPEQLKEHHAHCVMEAASEAHSHMMQLRHKVDSFHNDPELLEIKQNITNSEKKMKKVTDAAKRNGFQVDTKKALKQMRNARKSNGFSIHQPDEMDHNPRNHVQELLDNSIEMHHDNYFVPEAHEDIKHKKLLAKKANGPTERARNPEITSSAKIAAPRSSSLDMNKRGKYQAKDNKGKNFEFIARRSLPNNIVAGAAIQSNGITLQNVQVNEANVSKLSSKTKKAQKKAPKAKAFVAPAPLDGPINHPHSTMEAPNVAFNKRQMYHSHSSEGFHETTITGKAGTGYTAEIHVPGRKNPIKTVLSRDQIRPFEGGLPANKPDGYVSPGDRSGLKMATRGKYQTKDKNGNNFEFIARKDLPNKMVQGTAIQTNGITIQNVQVQQSSVKKLQPQTKQRKSRHVPPAPLAGPIAHPHSTLEAPDVDFNKRQLYHSHSAEGFHETTITGKTATGYTAEIHVPGKKKPVKTQLSRDQIRPFEGGLPQNKPDGYVSPGDRSGLKLGQRGKYQTKDKNGNNFEFVPRMDLPNKMVQGSAIQTNGITHQNVQVQQSNVKKLSQKTKQRKSRFTPPAALSGPIKFPHSTLVAPDLTLHTKGLYDASFHDAFGFHPCVIRGKEGTGYRATVYVDGMALNNVKINRMKIRPANGGLPAPKPEAPVKAEVSAGGKKAKNKTEQPKKIQKEPTPKKIQKEPTPVQKEQSIDPAMQETMSPKAKNAASKNLHLLPKKGKAKNKVHHELAQPHAEKSAPAPAKTKTHTAPKPLSGQIYHPHSTYEAPDLELWKRGLYHSHSDEGFHETTITGKKGTGYTAYIHVPNRKKPIKAQLSRDQIRPFEGGFPAPKPFHHVTKEQTAPGMAHLENTVNKAPSREASAKSKKKGHVSISEASHGGFVDKAPTRVQTASADAQQRMAVAAQKRAEQKLVSDKKLTPASKKDKAQQLEQSLQPKKSAAGKKRDGHVAFGEPADDSPRKSLQRTQTGFVRGVSNQKHTIAEVSKFGGNYASPAADVPMHENTGDSRTSYTEAIADVHDMMREEAGTSNIHNVLNKQDDYPFAKNKQSNHAHTQIALPRGKKALQLSPTKQPIAHSEHDDEIRSIRAARATYRANRTNRNRRPMNLLLYKKNLLAPLLRSFKNVKTWQKQRRINERELKTDKQNPTTVTPKHHKMSPDEVTGQEEIYYPSDFLFQASGMYEACDNKGKWFNAVVTEALGGGYFYVSAQLRNGVTMTRCLVRQENLRCRIVMNTPGLYEAIDEQGMHWDIVAQSRFGNFLHIDVVTPNGTHNGLRVQSHLVNHKLLMGVTGLYTARDSMGHWWPVNVRSRCVVEGGGDYYNIDVLADGVLHTGMKTPRSDIRLRPGARLHAVKAGYLRGTANLFPQEIQLYKELQMVPSQTAAGDQVKQQTAMYKSKNKSAAPSPEPTSKSTMSVKALGDSHASKHEHKTDSKVWGTHIHVTSRSLTQKHDHLVANQRRTNTSPSLNDNTWMKYHADAPKKVQKEPTPMKEQSIDPAMQETMSPKAKNAASKNAHLLPKKGKAKNKVHHELAQPHGEKSVHAPTKTQTAPAKVHKQPSPEPTPVKKEQSLDPAMQETMSPKAKQAAIKNLHLLPKKGKAKNKVHHELAQPHSITEQPAAPAPKPAPAAPVAPTPPAPPVQKEPSSPSSPTKKKKKSAFSKPVTNPPLKAKPSTFKPPAPLTGPINHPHSTFVAPDLDLHKPGLYDAMFNDGMGFHPCIIRGKEGTGYRATVMLDGITPLNNVKVGRMNIRPANGGFPAPKPEEPAKSAAATSGKKQKQKTKKPSEAHMKKSHDESFLNYSNKNIPAVPTPEKTPKPEQSADPDMFAASPSATRASMKPDSTHLLPRKGKARTKVGPKHNMQMGAGGGLIR